MEDKELKKLRWKKKREEYEAAADIFIWFRDWLKKKDIRFFLNPRDQLEDRSYISDLSVPAFDFINQAGKPASSVIESKRNAMRKFYEHLKNNNLCKDKVFPKFRKPLPPCHIIDPPGPKFYGDEESFWRVKNAIQYYEAYEAEWIISYGNWTEDNARHRFNSFKQEHEIDDLEIKYTTVGPSQEVYYVAEINFYVKFVSTEVRARGYGRNKIQAARRCTLNALQQLFDRNLLEDAKEPKEIASLPVLRVKPKYSINTQLSCLLRKLKVPYVKIEDKSAEVSLLCYGRASRVLETQRDKREDECFSGNEEDKGNKEEKDDEQHSGSEPEDEPMDSTNVDDNNLIPVHTSSASQNIIPVPEKDSISNEVARAEEAAARAEEEAARVEEEAARVEEEAAQYEIFEEVAEKSCLGLWMPAQMNWNPWEEMHITSGRYFHQHLDVLSSIMQKECYNSRKNPLEPHRQQLPIYEKKLEILQNVNTNSVTIIRSKNGCGKSTQVAQFVLDQYIYNEAGARCNVLVSEPCDLNAISIAERVALERDQSLGQSVGYATRYKSVYPQAYGSILFCSADVIIKKFRTGLKGISHVIIDEAHVAHSNYNLLLSLLREMSQHYSSLRIILLLPDMADEGHFVRFFRDAVMINMESDFKQISHTFIEDFIETTKYLPEHMQNDEKYVVKHKGEEIGINAGDSYSQNTLNLVSQVAQKPESHEELLEAILAYIINMQLQGTTLIYLSSSLAVQSLYKRLKRHKTFGKPSFTILQLHPHVSIEEIHRIFESVPSGYRKIVLATSIAETFAIPDVHFVIDTCRDSSSLYTEPTNEISFASPLSLSLRKSQAGLSRPGLYFSLCTKKTYNKFQESKCDYNVSMLKASLPKAMLSIKSMNLGNPIEILSQSIHPMEIEDIEKAESKLKKWNCLNEDGKLNATGRMIAQFSTNPEVGKVVMLGCLFAIADHACALASIVMTPKEFFLENEPFSHPLPSEKQFQGTRLSDHIVKLRFYQEWENLSELEGVKYCRENKLSLDAFKSIFQLKDYLLSLVKKNGFPTFVYEKQNLNYDQQDARLCVLVSLPLILSYPNFGFFTQKKQLIRNGKPMNIDVWSPVMYTLPQFVLSPMFAFSEKIPSTVCETAKDLSMISPLALFIFGCEKIVFSNGVAQLDDWMSYRIEGNEAAALVGARVMIHEMLMIICEKPAEICEETLVKSGQDEPWWNKELEEARLLLKNLSRKSNRRRGNKEIFAQYKEARRNVRRLKRQSILNAGIKANERNRYLKKSPKIWKRMLKTVSHICDIFFTSATTPKRDLNPRTKRILLDDPLMLPAPSRRWQPDDSEDVVRPPQKVSKQMKKMAKSLQCPCVKVKKDGGSSSLMGCGPNCWKLRGNSAMDVAMNFNTAGGLHNLLGSHTQGYNNFRNPQIPIRPGMGFGDNSMGPGNFPGRDYNWGPNRDNWGPNNFPGRDFNRGPNRFQGNFGNNRGNHFSNRDINMGPNNGPNRDFNDGFNNYGPNRDFNGGFNNYGPNRDFNGGFNNYGPNRDFNGGNFPSRNYNSGFNNFNY